MIAISTTLSASEYKGTAGVTLSATNSKQSFNHPLMTPRTVILDPAATLDTPLWLLFATGIRAVDHACEGFCNPKANPATEPQSLQGLRLLHRSMPRIKSDPGDLDARMEAQFGMWQAIAPSQSGVAMGASHGIGYALGATFGVPHGHTSCVMLPAVLTWNATVNGERQKALSEAMGAPARPAGELGQGARRRARPADVIARRRNQAREPRRDRSPCARLPARSDQSAKDLDRSRRARDPGACVVSRAARTRVRATRKWPM